MDIILAPRSSGWVNISSYFSVLWFTTESRVLEGGPGGRRAAMGDDRDRSRSPRRSAGEVTESGRRLSEVGS